MFVSNYLWNLDADVSKELSCDLQQSQELLIFCVAITFGISAILKHPQNGSNKRKTLSQKSVNITGHKIITWSIMWEFFQELHIWTQSRWHNKAVLKKTKSSLHHISHFWDTLNHIYIWSLAKSCTSGTPWFKYLPLLPMQVGKSLEEKWLLFLQLNSLFINCNCSLQQNYCI